MFSNRAAPVCKRYMQSREPSGERAEQMEASSRIGEAAHSLCSLLSILYTQREPLPRKLNSRFFCLASSTAAGLASVNAA